jgi:hypothetical protein
LIYYVYKHIDPRTSELLYIGHGCRGRAWIHGSKRSVLRSQDHLDHLEALTQDGFVATDWVEIVTTGLPKKEACKIEQGLIREHKPLYNKPNGKHLLKLTPDQVQKSRELREQGLYYQQIAEIVKVSTMTVYRALNGKTENIGEEYGH